MAPSPAAQGHDVASRWLIPPSIVEASPEPQATLEPAMFRFLPDVDATMPLRPSRRRALEALPEGGSVLDVGVGAGASSFGLRHRAGLITGVDRLPDMLLLFEETARELGVRVRAVLGAWPDAEVAVEPADVAVCHHALYAADDLVAYARALTDRARHRVVLEMSAHPPLVGLNPLLERFHGFNRPDWPVADLAQAVLREMGLDVQREDIEVEPRRREVTPEWVAFVRRRLYVGPEADPVIEQFLRSREPKPEQVVALWWPGAA
jgi:SAM-dependent methyltransferase